MGNRMGSKWVIRDDVFGTDTLAAVWRLER